MSRSSPSPAVLAVFVSMLVLAACNREQPAGNAQPPPVDQPAQAVPPATAPAIAATGLARWDGYGDMRFGMNAEETKKAWGGDLNGKPGKGEICYYLNPVSSPSPKYFALMLESDKFVRYDVGNDKEVAPGGGRRGMNIDEIRKLYAGRNEEQPHKYVKGGRYVRIKSEDGSNGILVFETDAAGKVTEWRVGVEPQVDYLEGCS